MEAITTAINADALNSTPPGREADSKNKITKNLPPLALSISSHFWICFGTSLTELFQPFDLAIPPTQSKLDQL